jgi:hypothetical protein
MTNLFKAIRFWVYLAAFACAAVVLGLSANFAAKFLPLHRDFLIFSLVVSAFTLTALIVLCLRSQPRFDIAAILLLSIMWLANGAYSADVIGHVECDMLSGSMPTKNGGSYSSQGYCRQMKVIEAFSWACFVILIISWMVLLTLTTRAHARGDRHIWSASVSDLPWFGQYDTNYPGAAVYYPQTQPMNGQPIYQLPGHNVVIQNGQVTQIPTTPGSMVIPG